MIKLVLTDMDGTFLNNRGDFNRNLYNDVKKIMREKDVFLLLLRANNASVSRNCLVMM